MPTAAGTLGGGRLLAKEFTRGDHEFTAERRVPEPEVRAVPTARLLHGARVARFLGGTLAVFAAMLLTACGISMQLPEQVTNLLGSPAVAAEQVAAFEDVGNGLRLDRRRFGVALHVEGLEHGLRQPEVSKSCHV